MAGNRVEQELDRLANSTGHAFVNLIAPPMYCWAGASGQRLYLGRRRLLCTALLLGRRLGLLDALPQRGHLLHQVLSRPPAHAGHGSLLKQSAQAPRLTVSDKLHHYILMKAPLQHVPVNAAILTERNIFRAHAPATVISLLKMSHCPLSSSEGSAETPMCHRAAEVVKHTHINGCNLA